MNILQELRGRFAGVLSNYAEDPSSLLAMITPAQNPQHGDYQANCAMPLKAQTGKPPREIAQDIINGIDVADMCEPPEIAGPGFINLRLKQSWLEDQLQQAREDDRLGVLKTSKPKTYVIDYSAPNVAKPMHVGHIRSTVIGDALCRTLRFLGHTVIGDNHLGDWGTQFGMIIYGYKNFLDDGAYAENPVQELARLYRQVNSIQGYHAAVARLPKVEAELASFRENLSQSEAAEKGEDAKAAKAAKKEVKRLRKKCEELQDSVQAAKENIEAVNASPALLALCNAHPNIRASVLEETAKLHAGDKENLRLWEEILPPCLEEIHRIYQRLGVVFDHEHGESYYHEMLAGVVSELQEKGLAKESEGAVCVFLEEFDTPMIIQKRDGAFLYATSDLATIAFRASEWSPDAILYVVGAPQAEHFGKLFAACRLWKYPEIELTHVAFGSVLDENGEMYRTRSGSVVGLEGLLDEAVAKGYAVVCANDDKKPGGAELPEEERRNIAEVVGLGGIKYADLSHNRTSDYIFSYDKMMATEGNTATYMQYAYARVQSILRKSEVDLAELRSGSATIQLDQPAERTLGLAILRFSEALADMVVEYRPNILTGYLFDQLAKSLSTFYDQCPVLKAETEEIKQSRLLLCDLTGRTLKQGLDLLGIGVVERM